MFSIFVLSVHFLTVINAFNQIKSNLSDDYNSIFYIVGGQPATIDQAPWQANIVLVSPTTERVLCGGALIGKRAVLTAAHCCDEQNIFDMRVRYGGIDRTKLLHENNVTHKALKPNWNRAKLDGDWCILFLTSEVKESEHVKFIEIADKEPAVGTVANLTGWGATTYDKPFPTKLYCTQMHIISNDECRVKWNSTYNYQITKNMICAMSSSSSGCHGDSGGPLVVNDKLIGIMSFGIDECSVNQTVWPNMFANIVVAKPWIMEQINYQG